MGIVQGYEVIHGRFRAAFHRSSATSFISEEAEKRSRRTTWGEALALRWKHIDLGSEECPELSIVCGEDNLFSQ
jgi:hypothetical protein